MSKSIIAQSPSPDDKLTSSNPDPRPAGNPAPAARYYRILPLNLHTGQWLHTADGVIEVGGVAWLGQVRGRGATFVVAPFLVGNTPAYRAPVGWQADIVATSIDGGDGDEPPPPRACRRVPLTWDEVIAARRALLAEVA